MSLRRSAAGAVDTAARRREQEVALRESGAKGEGGRRDANLFAAGEATGFRSSRQHSVIRHSNTSPLLPAENRDEYNWVQRLIASDTKFILAISFVAVNLFKDLAQAYTGIRSGESEGVTSTLLIPGGAIIVASVLTTAICRKINACLREYAEDKSMPKGEIDLISSNGRITSNILASAVSVSGASAIEEVLSFKVSKSSWKPWGKEVSYAGIAAGAGFAEFIALDCINRFGEACLGNQTADNNSGVENGDGIEDHDIEEQGFCTRLAQKFCGDKANWKETIVAAIFDAVASAVSQIAFMNLLETSRKKSWNPVAGAALIGGVNLVINTVLFCFISYMESCLHQQDDSKYPEGGDDDGLHTTPEPLIDGAAGDRREGGAIITSNIEHGAGSGAHVGRENATKRDSDAGAADENTPLLRRDPRTAK